MQCEVTGGQFKTNIETTGFDYFGIDELPELAEEKNNKEQIAMCFNAMQSENGKLYLIDFRFSKLTTSSLMSKNSVGRVLHAIFLCLLVFVRVHLYKHAK